MCVGRSLRLLQSKSSSSSIAVAIVPILYSVVCYSADFMTDARSRKE